MSMHCMFACMCVHRFCVRKINVCLRLHVCECTFLGVYLNTGTHAAFTSLCKSEHMRVLACEHACVIGRASRYSTSHSERHRGRARAAGRRRDRQLFPPHISVQRRHQSLAEMSVLQAGDRPLNVSPSQVNTESQPAIHRQWERAREGETERE